MTDDGDAPANTFEYKRHANWWSRCDVIVAGIIQVQFDRYRFALSRQALHRSDIVRNLAVSRGVEYKRRGTEAGASSITVCNVGDVNGSTVNVVEVSSTQSFWFLTSRVTVIGPELLEMPKSANSVHGIVVTGVFEPYANPPPPGAETAQA